MNTENFLFCKIYIDANIELDDLCQGIARALGITDFTVKVMGYGIDLRANEDFDQKLRVSFPDGFLHFAYCLEAFANSRVQDIAQVDLATRILEYLWAHGFSAVAACDYEEDLPQKGGYKSREVPWPGA